MTDFDRQDNDTSNMLQRTLPTTETYQERERSMLIGWVVGLLSIIPDVTFALMANSVTMLMDVLRTASDTGALFLSWLTIRRVAQGKSKHYNYGYGKLENLANLSIGLAMVLSFIIVVDVAIKRFHIHEHVDRVGWGIAFNTLAGIGNAWFWWKNHWLARRQPSPIMESQWRIFRAKTVINACVLMTLIASMVWHDKRWGIYIDPMASFVLAAFLLFNAFRLFSMSVYDLLDHSLEESMQILIHRGLVAFQHRYIALHGIRSRRSGSRIYIEIFLQFDENLLMSDVQRTIDDMREALEASISNSQIIIAPSTQAEL